ncbi:acyl-CoA dehydrogenase family protein [Streptomyces sp. GQFP]|uniref:acyl-CoA dehydrogenase family protein n=1 Tax=Streptomyces sp. GQFP TaxID=2907545 RepID=UPI001F421D9D|nr:acyl-CoA dehydrogenase family protein [Streptomyces sp. GQFP]UIX31965.1 acyl-CoA dehydrogenase family protein [Streptomyces sp. GQFP]
MSQEQTVSIRKEIRAAIQESGTASYTTIDSWLFGFDPAFSRHLGAGGFIGLTWPEEVGGRAVTNAERQVVTEELLRIGAPVAAHWIGDRQIGPALLRHGSPELRQAVLPRIRSGEISFCLGMSETESGSDLSAVRTRLTEVDGGFRMNGGKIWTSHAHHATHAYVLARLGTSEDKHDGLVEMVLDMATPGIEVRPILDIGGEHHFNEVTFTDVLVPRENVIGEVGGGWRQVTEQLSFERGGMERVLSTFPLLAVLLRDGLVPDTADAELGVLVARLHTLRAMARTVADAMDRGRAPVAESSMLKFLGTAFEGDVVDFARRVVGPPDPAGSIAERLLAQGLVRSPGATIRGGTTEMLLSIISRAATAAPPGAELRGLVSDVLAGWEHAGSAVEDHDQHRTDLAGLGWNSIAVAEERGGSGGGLGDLAAVVAQVAEAGWSLPLAENVVAYRVLATPEEPLDPAALAVTAFGAGVTAHVEQGEVVLAGRQERVAWGRSAATLLVRAQDGDREILVRVPTTARGVGWEPGVNIAGEPRDALLLDQVRVPVAALVADESALGRARGELLALRNAALCGAMRGACGLALEHASTRTQFGRTIDRFQAVSHHLARMKADVTFAETASEESLRECAELGPAWRTVAGALVTARAASAVVKSAHQVLGAMGTTQEHGLHRRSLRIWAWRDELGTEGQLGAALGTATLEAGLDPMWDWLVHERPDLGVAPPRLTTGR